MFAGVVGIGAAGFFLWFQIQRFQYQHGDRVNSPQTTRKLKKLWQQAEDALKDRDHHQAEKYLLKILKLDHKNPVAYNRLGVMYARNANLEDAVECLEIASSITPTVASLYNLGLIHYEREEYQEAANAFERVIDLEPTAARYIAFAKALSKLGQTERMVEALEAAVAMKKTIRHLELLIPIHERLDNYDRVEEIKREIARMRRESK